MSPTNFFNNTAKKSIYPVLKVPGPFSNLLFTVKIQGTSMMPDLIPGRLYLASKLKRPKLGSKIVFTNGDKTFVKKIASQNKNGFKVSGNYSWSTSSQTLGTISKNKIIGTIL